MISTVISYFTAGLPPLSFTAGGKVPASYWGPGSGEDEMEFFRGALVRGVVDKNVFGKYGLVHAVQVRVVPPRVSSPGSLKESRTTCSLRSASELCRQACVCDS